MNRTQQLIDKAVAELKLTRYGYTELKAPSGHWAAGLKLLAQARATLDPPKRVQAKVDLGPIVRGGTSILQMDATHVTDGMNLHGSVWPALDDGFGHPGLTVIAPENVRVTGHGHAKRRDGRPNGVSINIAVGDSGIEYWIGHLDTTGLAPVGAKVKKGGKLGVITANHEAPHVHLGINACKLLGGKDLLHHNDYTHGAPLIGLQLKNAGH